MSKAEKLSVVDQDTVQKLIVDRSSPILRLINEVDQRHPALGNVIAAEFMSKGKGVVTPIIYGALTTAVLLEHAQTRVGGIVPEQVSEDAVRTALISVLDNTDEEVKAVGDQFREVQKELFDGLRFFSNTIVEKGSAYCELGGLITLTAYSHILEAQELKKKLNWKA